jgi:aspartyl-tRNA(Asn)/glutamyl-tRNA(Gln) amidotransferase subunit C
MEINKKFVKHIAELSRINLKDSELEKFTPQMKTILDSVPVLQELDTTGVQPMKKHIPFSNLREDIAGESLSQSDVLVNAKHSENGLVKVYGKVFGDIEES